jgi:hypothetical protein
VNFCCSYGFFRYRIPSLVALAFFAHFLMLFLRETLIEEEVAAGRLVLEQALESAEVQQYRAAHGIVSALRFDAQAAWVQEDEAAAGGGGDGGVKSAGEGGEVDEQAQETIRGDGESRRRARKDGEDDF